MMQDQMRLRVLIAVPDVEEIATNADLEIVQWDDPKMEFLRYVVASGWMTRRVGYVRGLWWRATRELVRIVGG